MAHHAADQAVSTLLRHVAATQVMPRFRNLSDADIAEKTPGEIVTTADREAELRLAEGLRRIEAIRIVGEEAVASDPDSMAGIGEGRLWLIDPIDGTANFAAGRSPFGLMIGLVADGVVEAGWLYDPVLDRMCHAHRGNGAFINAERVTARATGRPRPIAALATWIMDAAEREAVEARAASDFELVPIPRCAAEQYPGNVLGRYDISLFKRTLPWDHAPGSLFLTEAGGHVAHWDGSAYAIGNGKTGILAAASAGLWHRARDILALES